MSFGFAVGDFITIGKLVKETISCLRSVGRAELEYQELVRDLKALDTSLQYLGHIDNDMNASAHISPIKTATTTCRLRLEGFLSRVQKYERSMGSTKHASTLRTTSDKLGWHFGQKDQIEQLRRDIHICHSIISPHLAQYSLERLEILRATTEIDFSHTSEQLYHTQTALEHIKKGNTSQAVMLNDVQTLLQDIHQFVFGDIKPYLIRLLQLISSTFTSTQQIYEILLDIRNIISVDRRWTFFQAPLEVEDAFGVRFPIPTEYDYDLIDTVIRHRFKIGGGSMEVKAGNYELCRKQNRLDIITESSRLQPGTAITMFIIVSSSIIKQAAWPIPCCESAEVIPCPGGGFGW
ncbi:hypothetical protein BKA58DRAFT_322802 [Alternaria rosae]|uniref:uncharacterized protein n=1 Tax=Alternaria rosae TaxID=1187941 RepID=UPI001E8EA4BF|nr:uncharacterized protein BKA58DRAFT_322802 [Alternaria rosae]KAH6860840.1 hypothetical protein BKA58DRAFT_322802 [Alternaria rosae]